MSFDTNQERALRGYSPIKASFSVESEVMHICSDDGVVIRAIQICQNPKLVYLKSIVQNQDVVNLKTCGV